MIGGMSDHLPECGYKQCNCGYEDDPRGNWAGHLRCSHVPCICDRLRQCEQRVTAAHIAILESAKPSGNCDCDWCADHDWLISDLINALREGNK